MNASEIMDFYQSAKFKDYDWEQLEGVILYNSDYKKDISEIKKQFTYLIFECGYGCDTSMRLLKYLNNNQSNLQMINSIKEYRNHHLKS